MLLLDFLSHALNTLTASVPSLLTPSLVSDPKTENPPQTLTTPIARTPHSNHDTPNPQRQRRLQKPPPTQLSLTIDAPLRTSHKRHDSMNSAKMNNSNVQVVQAVPSAREAGVLNPHTGFHEPLSPGRIPFPFPFRYSRSPAKIQPLLPVFFFTLLSDGRREGMKEGRRKGGEETFEKLTEGKSG